MERATRFAQLSTSFLDIHLRGDWSRQAWEDHAATGTVLERLRQRQAQAPDEVDAAALAMMEQAAAATR
jgi:hypothetical protein